MTEWKESVPRPAKKIYQKVHNLFLNPESDWLFDKRYPDILTIRQGEIRAVYDTSNLVTKRWFYPRYRNGSLHEPVVTRALLKQLNSDSVFFDVGANVGFYTILAAHRCNSVHSFEIDPRLASIIYKHLAQNPHRAADVQIVLGAVSDETGRYISFTPHITENLSTNSITNKGDGSQFNIQTVSIDEYSKQTRTQPNVLKVDVEGAEVAVLDGLSSSLSEIETLFLEVHPSLLNRFGDSVFDVFDRLNEYGFDVQRFADHREDISPEKSLNSITDIEHLGNSMLLCTK